MMRKAFAGYFTYIIPFNVHRKVLRIVIPTFQMRRLSPGEVV